MVTDGRTLLGADDKAGVTAIVSATEYLLNIGTYPIGQSASAAPDEGQDGSPFV